MTSPQDHLDYVLARYKRLASAVDAVTPCATIKLIRKEMGVNK